MKIKGILVLAMMAASAFGSASAVDAPEEMMQSCRARAAKAYKTAADGVEVKYEGQRVDGTHAVNGTVIDTGATFQCSFIRKGGKIIKFIRNKVSEELRHDAKVAGTNFHATGDIPCTIGEQSAQCHFGVIRQGGGSATVKVDLPGGGARTIRFRNGRASSSDGQGSVRSEKSGDISKVSIGTTERYEIFDAILFGG